MVWESDMTFDIDLWPIDLYINRGHMLIKNYLPSKFKDHGAKRCWVISSIRCRRLTWFWPLTYWPEYQEGSSTVLQLSICVNFSRSYAPFGTYNTGNTVSHSLLLHALTYCAEILHMTLFCSTTDQVWVSTISFNFCRSYIPFWNLEYSKYTVFRSFLLYALTYWAEILHMTLFYCTTDKVEVLSICVNFLYELCPFWN